MVCTDVNIDELKTIKKIKLIAKWFLAIEAIIIITRGLAMNYCIELIFTADGWMKGFFAVCIYIAIFSVLTSGVVFKKNSAISIRLAKAKLILISAFGITPEIIFFFASYLFYNLY